MMRLFSSRRESITADLRARAAQFEQRYGRKPSQRELAHLAQASNFKTRAAKHGTLDVAQAARGLGGQARADPRRAPGVGRAVGVARPRRKPRGHARARPGLTRRGPVPGRGGPRGAEGGGAGPAGQVRVDAGRCDQVPGPGAAPVRDGPGRGRRPAGGPGRPGAGVGVRAGGVPGGARAGRRCRAACCAPTGAASTSGTAAPGTPPARSWPWKSACSRTPARAARRAWTARRPRTRSARTRRSSRTR